MSPHQSVTPGIAQPHDTPPNPAQGAHRKGLGLWRLSGLLAVVALGAAMSAHAAPGAECSAEEAGATHRLIASIETFNKVTTLLEHLTDHRPAAQIKIPLTFAPALLKDLKRAQAQGGNLNPLTSHTLETIGTFGLKTLPTVVERLKDAGRLPASFKVLPATFGIEDIVAGGASQIGRGRLGIDEITRYLDGVSKATAAIAGTLVAGPRGAKIGESAAGVAQHVLRGLTMPLFQEMANRPVRQAMITNWRTLQDSQLARGQPVRRFSELYPLAGLRQVGFDAKTVADMDRYAVWLNSTHGGTDLRAALPARQAHTPQVSSGLAAAPGPGGICLGGPQTYQVTPDLHHVIESLARDAAEAGDDATRAPHQP